MHVDRCISVWLCGFYQSDDWCVYHKETILITTKSTVEINISEIVCMFQSGPQYSHAHHNITPHISNQCWIAEQHRAGKKRCHHEKHNKIVEIRIFYFIFVEIDEDKVGKNVRTRCDVIWKRAMMGTIFVIIQNALKLKSSFSLPSCLVSSFNL